MIPLLSLCGRDSSVESSAIHFAERGRLAVQRVARFIPGLENIHHENKRRGCKQCQERGPPSPQHSATARSSAVSLPPSLSRPQSPGASAALSAVTPAACKRPAADSGGPRSSSVFFRRALGFAGGEKRHETQSLLSAIHVMDCTPLSRAPLVRDDLGNGDVCANPGRRWLRHLALG